MPDVVIPPRASAVPGTEDAEAQCHGAHLAIPMRRAWIVRPLSVAALQSEGPHWIRRPGSAPQAQSDYSHSFPRRADGRVGGLLRCINPSCCPRQWPLDRSATIGTLCTNPSWMRPLETPLEQRTPEDATSEVAP